MIKNNKVNTMNIGQACDLWIRLVMIFGGSIVPYYAYSSEDRVEAIMAPTPSAPNPATVSLGVTSVTNIIPGVALLAAPTYSYTVTNTIRGSAMNFTSASIVITCTAFPNYQIYSGGGSLSGATATAATFTTTTPGTTCPAGTASCGTNPTTTITLLNTGAVVSVTDTNYNKAFTSVNTGWNAYVTGYYQCTYTDPNLTPATTMTVIVPWGQGT